MGQSSDGILCYGINFGALEDVEDNSLDKLAGLVEYFYDILYSAMTEDPIPSDDYLLGDDAGYKLWRDAYQAFLIRRNKWAKDSPFSKMQLQTHCSYDYPMYILTHEDVCFSASRGYPKEINLGMDLRPPLETMLIKETCELLGLSYSQPKWWLASVLG